MLRPADVFQRFSAVFRPGADQREHVGPWHHSDDSHQWPHDLEEILAAYAIMGNIDKFSTVTCFALPGPPLCWLGNALERVPPGRRHMI